MNDDSKTPSPEKPDAEVLSPDISLYRRVLKILGDALAVDDPKTKLQGNDRLIAEVIFRRSTPVASAERYREFSEWKAAWTKLQTTIDSHCWPDALKAWNRQQSDLHARINNPNHEHSQILDRAGFEKRFDSIRESAKEEQKKLYRQHIAAAREVAAVVVQILEEEAVAVQATEEEKYKRFGLPFPGSTIVSAIKNAALYVQARVANSGDSTAGPDLVAPYLLMD